MFSSDICARDLIFSNPIDHFLSQDQEIRTSYESGFNSSINHTGSSKEIEYRSSQDLFSQKRSQDLFSQNEKFDSQSEAAIDYHRYISQNLLIGKETPKSFLSFSDKDKGITKEKKEPPIIQKEFDEIHIKEIKNFLETLSGNIKILNSEVEKQNKNLREELLKLNEKISLVEKTIGQKVELIADNSQNFATAIKKDENGQKHLCDKLSEVSENVKSLESKMEEFEDQNKRMFQENIRKISKIYETVHKNQLQKIQNQYSQTEKAIWEMNSVVESSIKSIEENFKNILDQKFNCMNNILKNTIDQFVQSSRIYDSACSMSKQLPQTKMSDSSHDISNCTTAKKFMTIPHYNSNYNYQNLNAGRSEFRGQLSEIHDSAPLINKRIPQTRMWDFSKDISECFKAKQSMAKNPNSEYNYRNLYAGMPETEETISQNLTTRTPIIQYLNKCENNVEPVRKYPLRSRMKSEALNYKDPTSNSNIKIKRKISTPLGNKISPMFRKSMQNAMDSHCTPLISKIANSNTCGKTFFNKNENNFLQRKSEDRFDETNYSLLNSSPALTLFEAKHTYAFYPRHIYNE